jgi:enamine deaminase RidA (YjgF/YER057c/UK114 family)
VAAQTRAVLGIIEAALAEGGFDLSDVVRTRMFVTDISLAAPVLAVHAEVFGRIRPAATMVEVSALLEPTILIEIEAEARRG